MQCLDSHPLCHACVCKAVLPVRKERPADCGLAYECPACGQLMHLNGLHMMALLQRSWDAVTASFDDEPKARAWVMSAPRRRRRYACARAEECTSDFVAG
jgi:hypothetical protein